MLTIHDEELAARLQQIAELEHRPVEDILKAMVAQYPTNMGSETDYSDKNMALQHIRHKAYAKARLYWQSSGDTSKAMLTDEELDVQFAAFDEQGIPRLKSDPSLTAPPPGSLAYAARVLRSSGGIRTAGSLDASRADDILNEEFAEYLLRRMESADAAE